MFSVLGIIFFFILAIVLFGLSLISGVLRAIFGIGRRSNSSKNSASSRTYSNSTHGNEKENASGNNSQRKKIFDKEEGEYVDFEEIKEDDQK